MTACLFGTLMFRCALLVDTSGLTADTSRVPFGPATECASGLPQPSYLAADKDTVYWIQGASTVLSKPATCDGAPAVLAQSLKAPRALTEAGSSVFFAAGDSGGWTYAHEVPKHGGLAKKTFADGMGSERIPSISIEGNALALVSGATVKRGNTDGTGAFTVAKEQTGASSVVLRAPYVYWNGATSILRSNGASPQAPELFSPEAVGTSELVADDATLYWCSADGALRSLRFDQPAGAPVVLDSGLKSPRGLAVDDSYVYWASATTGEVAAVPKGGGARIVLATGQAEPYAIAATETAVFFTDRSAGTLMRIPRR